MKRTLVIGPLIGAILVVAAGCESPTKLGTTWKDPSVTGPLSFQKVAVVVVNSTPAERRAQEDGLVAQIKKATAVPSYTFISDSELTDRDKVKQRIREGGFDAAVVLRLIDSKKMTSYVPNEVSYWNAYYGYTTVQTPGYYVTDTVIRAELSLYSVPEGKLLWAGSSSSTNPGSAKELALQVARAAAEELRKQGLLQ